MKKTVAVLFGGCSPEYSVSLCSAAAVIRGLSAGAPADKYALLLVGITKEGDWYHYTGPVDAIEDGTWLQAGPCTRAILSPDRTVRGLMEWSDGGVRYLPVDVVFPMLHGGNGEDGTMQGLCELAGIPYVGCGVLGSAAGMDKDVAHMLAEKAGIRVPRSVALYPGEDHAPALETAKSFGYPLFVKPANAGSSYGITMVEREEQLLPAVELAFEYDRKAVIEEGIPGFEVGCAALGSGEDVFIGEVDEIELKQGWLDYEEKYGNRTAEIHLPARVAPEIRQKIKDAGRVLFKALCCDGFARIDMFLTPDNQVVFNEINTIPGFTAHSRYPKMLEAAGMDFSEIVDRLVELACLKSN